MAKKINLGKVGITCEGNYDPNKPYEKLVCVLYDGISWVSTRDVPVGNAPANLSAYWQKMSEKGEQGIRGPQGNSSFDGTGVEIVNNLTQGGEAAVLSAEQGKILDEKVTRLSTEVDTKLSNSIEQLNGASLWTKKTPTGYRWENGQWEKVTVTGFYSIIGYLNKGAKIVINNAYPNESYAGFYRCDGEGNLIESLGVLSDKDETYDIVISGFYAVYVQEGYKLVIHNVSTTDSIESDVKALKATVDSVEKDIANIEIKTQKFTYTFVPIYRTSDFADWQALDSDNRGSWNLTDSGLRPSTIGGYVNDYICGGVYLDRLYQSNQVVFLIEAELSQDTRLNIHFLRYIQTGTYPNDTTFIIDGNASQIILLKNVGRKILVEPYKTTNIPFALNGRYIIECKRINYTYSIKITNKVTGESCELLNEGNWNAGSMMSKLAFTWGGGEAPILKSVKIYEPDKLKAIIAGDSITEGLGLYYDSYSYILSQELGNTAISAASSATTEDVLKSFDSEFSYAKPQYLIVTIGTNDYSSSISNLKTMLQELILKCKSHGIIPIVNHIPCNMLDMHFVRGFNTMIDSLDVDGAMFDVATSIENNPENGCDASLFSDGIHPNQEGTQRMLQRAKMDLPFLFVE